MLITVAVCALLALLQRALTSKVLLLAVGGVLVYLQVAVTVLGQTRKKSLNWDQVSNSNNSI